VDACLCYVSLSSYEEALAIGRALVEERLAAAVNITSGVHSIYRWRGAIEEAPEVLLIAKTRSALVARLSARVVALHSYQCPAVVAVPISKSRPAEAGAPLTAGIRS
jgi:periplasmic divalent cation tolerance protein